MITPPTEIFNVQVYDRFTFEELKDDFLAYGRMVNLCIILAAALRKSISPSGVQQT